MEKDIWDEVMAGRLSLPKEDQDQGWHFCPSWDGLLIGPNSVESKYCDCDG